MKPLFRYMGGKRRLLPFYQPFLAHLPEHKLYVEPFFGGGAVFGSIRDTWHGPAIIGDTSRELVNLYKAVRDEDDFPERALHEFERLKAVPRLQEPRIAHFRQVCAEHRETPDPAKFLFLQNFQFNALNKEDEEGRFVGIPGVQLYSYERNIRELRGTIAQWQAALQNTKISLGSYEHHSFNPAGAFIFLDPPYRETTSYGKGEFSDEAQLRLVAWAKEQASQGATVLLANVDGGDGFFQEAMGDAGSIFIQKYKHHAKSSSGARAEVSELLAVFTPDGPWKHQALFKGTLFAEALMNA